MKFRDYPMLRFISPNSNIFPLFSLSVQLYSLSLPLTSDCPFVGVGVSHDIVEQSRSGRTLEFHHSKVPYKAGQKDVS